jgi:chromosome segregation ATPase
MFGNVISPPPISAVQELKDLLALVSDSKKSGQLLNQMEDALTAAADVVKVQNSNISDLNAKIEALKNKEADLAKRESSISIQVKNANAALADVSGRDSLVAKLEKEHKAKKAAFEDEQAAAASELNIKQKAVAKLQAEASQLKADSEALITEYEAKIAKLKSAIGD